MQFRHSHTSQQHWMTALTQVTQLRSDCQVWCHPCITFHRTMKNTTDEDWYERPSTTLEQYNLLWNTLSVWPQMGLQIWHTRMMHNTMNEKLPVREVFFFFHCIFHQEILCKTVHNVKHVISTALNFIWAWGVNHRQFISLLEDVDDEHTDLPYDSKVQWQSLGKVF